MPYPVGRHVRSYSVPELPRPSAEWTDPREAPQPPTRPTDPGAERPDPRISYVPALPDHTRFETSHSGRPQVVPPPYSSPPQQQDAFRSRSASPNPRLPRKSSTISLFSHATKEAGQRLYGSNSLLNLKKSVASLPRLSLSRHPTDLGAVPSEEHISHHKYFVRRPRALQLKYGGRILGVQYSDGELDLDALEAQSTMSRVDDDLVDEEPEENEDGERRSTDDVEKQRERLELFIDLLFVGVITNLGEHWYSQAFTYQRGSSISVPEFIILFIPTWRIWSGLQQFLSSYYMDDMIQRMIILWIMCLALVWGNHAPGFLPIFEGSQAHSAVAVATFIIIILSLSLTEAIYSIWIPWMRRIILIIAIAGIPSIALWSAILALSGWPRVWVAVGALVWDYLAMILMHSPIGGRIQGRKRAKRASDPEHTRRRFEQFFVICLGEGVFLLIRGSPLGTRWDQHILVGCLGFLVYFFVHYIYFNGDQTKTYIHALHRRWYIQVVYTTVHLCVYMALILGSSSVLYLVQYTRPDDLDESSYDWREIPCQSGYGTPTSGSYVDERSLPLVARAQPPPYLNINYEGYRMATAGVYIALAVIMSGTLILSVLNRPLDSRNTLCVGNRWLRLTPRFLVSVVFATVWLYEFDSPVHVIAIAASLTFAVYLCEFYMSMEKEWSFFEPKRAVSESGQVTRSVTRR